MPPDAYDALVAFCCAIDFWNVATVSGHTSPSPLEVNVTSNRFSTDKVLLPAVSSETIQYLLQTGVVEMQTVPYSEARQSLHYFAIAGCHTLSSARLAKSVIKQSEAQGCAPEVFNQAQVQVIAMHII